MPQNAFTAIRMVMLDANAYVIGTVMRANLKKSKSGFEFCLGWEGCLKTNRGTVEGDACLCSVVLCQ